MKRKETQIGVIYTGNVCLKSFVSSDIVQTYPDTGLMPHLLCELYSVNLAQFLVTWKTVVKYSWNPKNEMPTPNRSKIYHLCKSNDLHLTK